MIQTAVAAVEQVFSRDFLAVLGKAIVLTLVILALCGIGLEKLILAYVALPNAPWLATAIHAGAGLGLAVVLMFLIAPVSFVVAGFFFDELAEHVEVATAGEAGRGHPLPVAQAMWVGVKFGLLSLVVNLVALLLLFVPVVNAVAFFAANAFLLGRGFFELAALRYLSLGETRDLLRRHGVRIVIAGCLCAGVACIPLVNLLTPLFATALMVRVAQPLVRRSLPYRAV